MDAELVDEEGYDVSSEDNSLGLQLPNPNAAKANSQQANSLEALLAAKNKRIMDELAKFRVSLAFGLGRSSY
jgi:homeobox protein cut-like